MQNSIHFESEAGVEAKLQRWKLISKKDLFWGDTFRKKTFIHNTKFASSPTSSNSGELFCLSAVKFCDNYSRGKCKIGYCKRIRKTWPFSKSFTVTLSTELEDKVLSCHWQEWSVLLLTSKNLRRLKFTFFIWKFQGWTVAKIYALPGLDW